MFTPNHSYETVVYQATRLRYLNKLENKLRQKTGVSFIM